MASIILLVVGSLTCFLLSLMVARQKSSNIDGPFLQKENCVAYGLLSIGLAGAALYSFLKFRRQYELDQNRPLGLDSFGLDFNQPASLVFVILALGGLGYLVWTRKRKGFISHKKIVSEIGVLTVTLGIIAFGCFVWPTAWRYRTEPAIPSGVLPGPLEYQGRVVTEFRTNRITGEQQAKMGGQWEHEYERM